MALGRLLATCILWRCPLQSRCGIPEPFAGFSLGAGLRGVLPCRSRLPSALLQRAAGQAMWLWLPFAVTVFIIPITCVCVCQTPALSVASFFPFTCLTVASHFGWGCWPEPLGPSLNTGGAQAVFLSQVLPGSTGPARVIPVRFSALGMWFLVVCWLGWCSPFCGLHPFFTCCPLLGISLVSQVLGCWLLQLVASLPRSAPYWGRECCEFPTH